MRAAAFSYGVLTGFDETRVPSRSGPVSLLDRLDFLSGVSGGSVLAAYYGLARPRGAGRFQAALPRLPMPRRRCRPISASAISRAGCKAASTTRPAVPGLARRASVQSRDVSRICCSRPRPRVWINASDIYNRTAVHLRAGDVQRAVQRSVELSGLAGGGGLRGGAGGVRADRHSELSRRLSGRAAGLGAAGARQSECAAADQILRRCAASAIAPARSNTSSCSTAASSTITGSPASPSRGWLRTRRTVRWRRRKRSSCGAFCSWSSIPAAIRRASGRRPFPVRRRRSHHGGVGYRDRVRRDRQLFGLRRHHEGLARTR